MSLAKGGSLAENVVAVDVLPWEQFKKAAWAHGLGDNTQAFQSGWAIWLKEGYSLDAYFHELSHVHDMHYKRDKYIEDALFSDCWSTQRPWGYDELVTAVLGTRS